MGVADTMFNGELNSKIPSGKLADKWTDYRSNLPLVSPANKQKQSVIIVGTGLAGASAAASLAEMGYNVKAFCFQDSPRRAHSIAAQGGINASKNYQNDGDILFRSDDGSGGLTTYFKLDGATSKTIFETSSRHKDNVKANFGDGEDLQIYHDGTNSYICLLYTSPSPRD